MNKISIRERVCLSCGNSPIKGYKYCSNLCRDAVFHRTKRKETAKIARHVKIQQEIDGVGVKICVKCKEKKNMIDFSPQGESRGRKSRCRTCVNKTGERRYTIAHERENKDLLIKGLKRCYKCKEVKGIIHYYKRYNRFKGICKHCQGMERNPQYVPAIKLSETERKGKRIIRLWKLKIKEMVCEQKKIKQQQNNDKKEAVRVFLYWRKNIATKEWLDGWEYGLRVRYWHKAGREKANIWRKNNPEKFKISRKATGIKKRRRIKEVDDKTLTGKTVAQILRETKECPYCGVELTKQNTHLDHMDPISKGGLHSINNLIPCCAKCNSKKSNAAFIEWVMELKHPHLIRAWKLYEQKKQGLRC